MFIQIKHPVHEKDIWNWYNNINYELQKNFLSIEEKKVLKEYYKEAGLLRGWRRSFFRHHFARTFTKAANYLLDETSSPYIIDLGCGFGTQSLCFAIMGAHVLAIDMDETALEIFLKRKKFYESLLNRPLHIELHHCNIFDFDFSNKKPITGIYSMFAFNMMQPSERLIAILSKYSQSRCRLAILDGNNQSWLSRFIPTRRRENCLSPFELEQQLSKHFFMVVDQTPGFCIPPVIWSILPNSFLRTVDNLLGRFAFFAISYQTLAIKQ